MSGSGLRHGTMTDEKRKADRFPDPPHIRLVSRGCASKRSDRFLKLTKTKICGGA
jgi:hypothetical protein